jgi:hypothetical protein
MRRLRSIMEKLGIDEEKSKKRRGGRIKGEREGTGYHGYDDALIDLNEKKETI